MTYLIDLDLCSAGDPNLDIGNFLAHLTEYGLRKQGDPDAFIDVEKTIEDRLLTRSPRYILDNIRIYKWITMVRLGFLSTLYPDRKHLTGILLELCEERISSFKFAGR